MRNFGKTLLRIVVWIVAIVIGGIALTLGATAAGNAIASSSEAKRIVEYGQKVSVDGKEMNVVVRGGENEAAKTVVLLPGFGTAAPGIDFEPLIADLETKYRVVAVEPFGSGLSDDTDVPRTNENYVREVHAALSELGIDRYALAAHSISGIYSLAYVNAYPDEVTAFIGIDSSVPTQPGADEPLPIGLMQGMKSLGLMRQLDAAGPDPLEGLPYSQEQREQSRILTLKNSLSDAFVSEAELTGQNFRDAAEMSFPQDLPVLLIVAEGDDGDVAGWLTLHEEQAAQSDRGEVLLLPGDHYLHHEQSAEVGAAITQLLG